MWREGYVSGGDTRFFVRALGHGKDVIILLHGWPETGSMWRRVAPLLADAGYRVVAPDLKGFGKSAKPHDGYDPQTLADEISQLIRNLHVRKAVLVGHDWGGAVALATAFRHPGRVQGLVLADSPYRQLDLSASWHIPLFNLPVLPELAFKRAARPLVAQAIQHSAHLQEPFTDEVIDEYATSVAEDPAAWLSYYRSLSRRALRDWSLRRIRKRVRFLAKARSPHQLRVPALVIWGAKDPATPHHLAARVAYDLDAELVTIPDAGHFTPEEDPLAFARAVVAFVGEAPSRPKLEAVPAGA